MPDFDVLVVGAGIGGYTSAIRAAQLGLRVAVVEKDAVGGLCLNWGCIPSKALLHAADVANAVRNSHELGISHSDLSLDLGVAVDRSREVVGKLVGGVETLLVHNKVTVIRGTARLAADKSVILQPDNRRVTAANVIIATGAATRSLPSLPLDGERVITSRQALELRQAPESIVIVGGGPIGVEFAYLFRSYGAKVTVLEMLPRLLPNEDQDVSRQLERSFRAQGIEVRTGIAVSGAELTDSGVRVELSAGSETLQAERVLVGVGFGPNTEGLGLEDAGVDLENGWIEIDGRCRTNVPGIWAIGDVTGALLLAHVAAAQGACAVETIAGREPPLLEYGNMPRAVYCQPEVASLGLTEAQAKARGLDVSAGRFPLAANGKALAAGHTEGFVKVVADRSSGSLFGVHMIGHNATELLGEASLARLLEATPAELGMAVHPHPTISEALREAALAVTGEAIHFYVPPRNR